MVDPNSQADSAAGGILNSTSQVAYGVFALLSGILKDSHAVTLRVIGLRESRTALEAKMTLHDQRMKAEQHLRTVTKEQWRNFFVASDIALGVPAGEMYGGELVSEVPKKVYQMPYFMLAREWERWIHAFYDQKIVTDIAWMEIPEVHEPHWQPADAAEALVALVLYVRRDRFVEGGLASNIRQGEVQYAISLLADEFRPDAPE